MAQKKAEGGLLGILRLKTIGTYSAMAVTLNGVQFSNHLMKASVQEHGTQEFASGATSQAITLDGKAEGLKCRRRKMSVPVVGPIRKPR